MTGGKHHHVRGTISSGTSHSVVTVPPASCTVLRQVRGWGATRCVCVCDWSPAVMADGHGMDTALGKLRASLEALQHPRKQAGVVGGEGSGCDGDIEARTWAQRALGPLCEASDVRADDHDGSTPVQSAPQQRRHGVRSIVMEVRGRCGSSTGRAVAFPARRCCAVPPFAAVARPPHARRRAPSGTAECSCTASLGFRNTRPLAHPARGLWH